MDSERLPLPIITNDIEVKSIQNGNNPGDIIQWSGTEWVVTPAGPGTGNVNGTIFSTDEAITRWHGTSGVSLQNSTITLSDLGLFSNLASASYVSATTEYRLGSSTILSSTNDNLQIGIGSLALGAASSLNTAVGDATLPVLTLGTYNTAIGASAGNLLTIGSSNTLLGVSAGADITTGSTNIAIGRSALAGSATASNRIIIGFGGLGVANNALTIAGAVPITGFYFPSLATATTSNVLYYNSTTGQITYGAGGGGGSVFADGSFRVQNTTTTTKQLAFNCSNITAPATRTCMVPDGNSMLTVYNPMASVGTMITGLFTFTPGLTANDCTGYGIDTLISLTEGNNNTALGAYTLTTVTTGEDNTAVGANALFTCNAGSLNTAVGKNALYNTNGNNNTAIGSDALYTSATGNDNVAIGASAGIILNGGSRNTFVGTQAGQGCTTGTDNVLVGSLAGGGVTTGNRNIHIGVVFDDSRLVSGSNNIILGYDSYLLAETDHHSMVIGNTTGVGSNSTVIDINYIPYGPSTALLAYSRTSGAVTYTYSAGLAVVGSPLTDYSNTAVGIDSFYTLNGVAENAISNTALGYNALHNLIDDVASIGNTAVGNISGAYITTGAGNICIGSDCASTLTTGDNNVIIGSSANVTTNSDSQQIIIGAGVTGTASNQIRIGLGTHTTCFIGGITGRTTGGVAVPVVVDGNGQLGTVSSSKRYKDDIRYLALDETDTLLNLHPATFVYKSDENKKLNYGLIAEDVEQVLPNIVVYKDLDGQQVPDTVQYMALIPMLVNMVKQLSNQNAALLDRIIALENK